MLHAVVNLAFAARALGSPLSTPPLEGGPVHPVVVSEAVAIALPHATPTVSTTPTTVRAAAVRLSGASMVSTATTAVRRPLVVDRSMERFDRLAECESGGDTNAVSGPYRGAFQFLLDTWHDAGGDGDPVDASYEDQRAIAMRWSWLEDPARQWPVCWPLSA